MPRPTLIKFYLESNEDNEITCFFCRGRRCEQSFTVHLGGEIRIIGVHNECADGYADRQAQRLMKPFSEKE